MLKFYYTTSEGQDALQDRPYLSVGGYKSSNSVPNDDLGNLFNEVTPMTIQDNRAQYIALVLKNESDDDYQDIHLGINYPEDCYSFLEIAVVDMAEDSDGNPIMERVDNMYSRPYVGEFYSPEITEDAPNGINIGDIDSGGVVAIWFKRTLNTDFIQQDQSEVYEVDSGARYKKKELGQEDIIDLVIKYEI